MRDCVCVCHSLLTTDHLTRSQAKHFLRAEESSFNVNKEDQRDRCGLETKDQTTGIGKRQYTGAARKESHRCWGEQGKERPLSPLAFQ